MKILNYTTQIAVEKTINEIQNILAKHGAKAILCDYDGAGNIVALSFQIKTKMGDLGFRLPIDPKPFSQLLNDLVDQHEIPRKYKNCLDQARRIAWRIIKDWLEAQLELVRTSMVEIQQVFLPYMVSKTGQTLYEVLKEKHFDLVLEHKKSEKSGTGGGVL